ncbi:MAG: circularly permuted type 2 ATP-grasp protein [Cyanobacteriota/Melainabacteria group bacterium]
MVDPKRVEWLHWRGYSTDSRIDLSGWNEGFSFPAVSLKKIPYCAESFNLLSTLDFNERVKLQENLFESIDHSAMACIYMGVMKPSEFELLQNQLKDCTKAMLRLVQITAQDGIDGSELATLLKSINPKQADYLKSALESSVYFYANQGFNNPFHNIKNQPLYLDYGVDLLCNGSNFMLSEFQVRYMTPFAHLLSELSDAYESTFPDLFLKFGLKKDTYETRRNKHVLECFEKFREVCGKNKELTKVVLDAWCYRKNRGASLESTAKSLSADYVLFDELKAEHNKHEEKYRDKLLAIYNQAALNLIDPVDEFYGKLNVEKLEYYDELAWQNLLERYLSGGVYLASPPLTDIINDKGLSSVIPDIYRVLFGEELKIPIVNSTACWSYKNHKEANKAVLEMAKAEKDKFVISHRYLEGGLGIRVGRTLDQEEWDSFIDAFVAERPYLYVLRDHFEMDPDMSLRMLCSASIETLTSDVKSAKLELSDTIYARFTTTSPLSSDNHRSFLIFPSAKDGPAPTYEIVESNSSSAR